MVFVANDKIGIYKQKLEFWKTYILYQELDNFSMPKGFSDEIRGDINKCGFLYCRIKYQHLEDLQNSINNF